MRRLNHDVGKFNTYIKKMEIPNQPQKKGNTKRKKNPKKDGVTKTFHLAFKYGKQNLHKELKNQWIATNDSTISLV